LQEPPTQEHETKEQEKARISHHNKNSPEISTKKRGLSAKELSSFLFDLQKMKKGKTFWVHSKTFREVAQKSSQFSSHHRVFSCQGQLPVPSAKMVKYSL
jgi:hypothetical protein